MKLTEIQDLIKFVAKSGVSEVELQDKDFKIIIKTGNQKGKAPETVMVPAPMQQMPAQIMQQASSQPASEQKAPDVKKPAGGNDESKYVTIKSPMIGTFYRQSGPDKPVFANVGDEIKPGKVICIIEAMKLFNEIESDIQGRIVKVLVDDATPVEYDQPLFLVEPA
ncbi:MAG TPA: acetyl-CoA carboxylase biotin carboxyl carrier protein [Bacteroidia bacterium]|jgi:acetyl-CoA carboxylase biotin carboxyl carrier protein|nr:acetyl-CoA carboxylase biotin carboxyl carrier protein [Bacteroidia bacterium]